MKATITTLILVAALLGAAASQAGTWRVEQDGSGDFATLQPAVDAAASGDTILIGPGEYTEMTTAVNQAGHTIEVYAYWDDGKNLIFIGAGSDVVRFGPEEYMPNGASGSPCGVYSDEPSQLKVIGLGFRNLFWSVVNVDETEVSHSSFDGGGYGVGIFEHGGSIDHCVFNDMEYSVYCDFADSVRILDCVFSNARAYFGHSVHGVVENCTVNGGGVAKYYQSGGRVAGVDANCTSLSGIVCAWSQVEVSDSRITGGSTSIECTGAGALVEAHDNMFAYPDNWHLNMENYACLHAWHNDFYRESLGSQFFLKCFYYDNPSDAYVDVGNNFWGILDSTEHFLNLRIWDGNDDPDLQIIVDFQPIETEPLPVEEQSLDSFKSMFR